MTKNFCLLPWLHLHVLPDSTVIPCCVSPYDDSYGDGKTQSIKEIWNSDKFKKLRSNMLNDIPSEGCSRCYQIEKSGFVSLRESLNRNFKKNINLVSKTNEDGSLPYLDLKYIDIRFSNLCNFKCRGCGPTLSSAWHDDHQLLFDYKSDQPKIKSVSINSPDFWEEFKSLIPHAEQIYFGGGEPLITKEHFEILRLLDTLGKYDVTLCYNTNLSQLNYGNTDLAQLWLKFKHVKIGVSIDDLGDRAEYFRNGTKWEVIEKNLFKLRDNYKNINLYTNCTVNIMNIYYLPEIYNYLTSHEIIHPDSFHINLLLDPCELSAQVLPPELKMKVKEKLRNQIDTWRLNFFTFGKVINDFENVITFMEEKDLSEHLPLFRKNTLKLDSIRSESFADTFPELIELIQG